MPAKSKAHYAGDYQRRAAHIRAGAYADPHARCWRCGLTLDERRQTHPRATWDAGHIEDGRVAGELRAECSTCNRSAGATLGNLRREPRSRRWG